MIPGDAHKLNVAERFMFLLKLTDLRPGSAVGSLNSNNVTLGFNDMNGDFVIHPGKTVVFLMRVLVGGCLITFWVSWQSCNLKGCLLT